MIYSGTGIKVDRIDGDIAELRFDLDGESINKFNKATLTELQQATAAIAADNSLKGVLVSSAKESFIVGADIMEFGKYFAGNEEHIAQYLAEANAIFNAFEDLPVPTLVAINGLALGGGCEMVMSADFRVMSESAKIGLPEVKLGIMPGFGGTVRLPRLIGADNAIEWICLGSEQKAEKALRDGVADAVIKPESLHEAALAMLRSAIQGEL
ncbi:MAG: enoyl-CoA hydratase-related protein, partial [Oceanobacter sp.]